MTPEEAARLFADNRQNIDEIIVNRAWRANLSPEHTDAFRAWAIQRLVDDWYRLIGRFRGESSLSTFLAVTVAMLFREFRVQSAPTVGHEPHTTRNRIDGSPAARVRGVSAEGDASPRGALTTQVLSVGAVVGTAVFGATEAIAYAPFSPTPGYDTITDAARAVGSWLSGTHFWPAEFGDFANGLAALWSAPQLSLVDAYGRDIGATSVIVVEWVHPAGTAVGRLVIADFRADGARIPASLRAPGGSGHKTDDANARPAA